MIKVKFKEKDYLKLMELVYCGNWIISATKERDSRIKKYEEIEDKIFSQAPADFQNLIDYDKELKQYFPSGEFEEKMEEFIDEYNDDTFWEELILRLGRRDIALKYKDREKEFMKLLREDLWKENYKEGEKYSEEFGKYGVERLKIDYSATPANK
ncbi:MAG: hypothetical protein U9Q34_02300 [Elusimicrobiota bacterium]|nr:hypothetical protein [Elusimicrobiota bacterium]